MPYLRRLVLLLTLSTSLLLVTVHLLHFSRPHHQEPLHPVGTKEQVDQEFNYLKQYDHPTKPEDFAVPNPEYAARIAFGKDPIKPPTKEDLLIPGQQDSKPKSTPLPSPKPAEQKDLKPSPVPSPKPADQKDVKPSPVPSPKPATQKDLKPTPKPSPVPSPKPVQQQNPKPSSNPPPKPADQKDILPNLTPNLTPNQKPTEQKDSKPQPKPNPAPPQNNQKPKPKFNELGQDINKIAPANATAWHKDKNLWKVHDALHA